MEIKIPACEMAGVPTVPTRAAPRTKERKIVRKFNIGCLLSSILRFPSIVRGLRGFCSSLQNGLIYVSALPACCCRHKQVATGKVVAFLMVLAWFLRGLCANILHLLMVRMRGGRNGRPSRPARRQADRLWDEGKGDLGDFAGGVGPGEAGGVLGHGVEGGAVLEQGGQFM